jgi:NAD(P)-dependent dehydrogenase (short-subunit alcohol dehydrogenase family)
MKQLEGKCAIVTGAGSGMGKAIAHLFAAEGARVLASDVKIKRLEVFRDISNITCYTCDVSIENEVTGMVSEANDNFGSVDILVNNAGILDDFLPAAETPTSVWANVMGVNLNGPFFACRAALPLMLKKGSGIIINISSIGGLNGSRAGAAYTASKHALIGLTKNIGFMYARKGIRCNAIAPGGVNTNIAEDIHPNQFGFEQLSLGLGTNPRSGDPSEIAEVALFLASEKSSFINGAVVVADGGWTAY